MSLRNGTQVFFSCFVSLKKLKRRTHTQSRYDYMWMKILLLNDKAGEEISFSLVVSTWVYSNWKYNAEIFDDTWELSGRWELCKQKSHETFVVYVIKKNLLNQQQTKVKWSALVEFFSRTHQLIQSLSDYLIRKSMITSLSLEVITLIMTIIPSTYSW